jgi:spore maturation protein A
MLGYIWGGMLLIGIAVAVFTGSTGMLTNSIIDSSKDAVSLAIIMLGVVGMWSGMMKIAEKSGLMMPFLRFLFPTIPKGHKALDYISLNVVANMLGLGWASTPAGLKAMSELQKLNNSSRASTAMCNFLIFNLSSLQIVTINLIAYRAQYNALNPSDIIGPGLIATISTSVVSIIIIKIMNRATNEEGNKGGTLCK